MLCCGPLALVMLIITKDPYSEAKRTGMPLDSKQNLAFYLSIAGVALWVAGILATLGGIV